MRVRNERRRLSRLEIMRGARTWGLFSLHLAASGEVEDARNAATTAAYYARIFLSGVAL